MIPADVRASIAAIVLAHATGKSISLIYDYQEERHRTISARFYGNVLAALDGERRAQLTGELPDLFDHKTRSYIHLAQENGQYTGFNHHSGDHFRAEMRGETVALFDHSNESWSQFAIVDPA